MHVVDPAAGAHEGAGLRTFRSPHQDAAIGGGHGQGRGTVAHCDGDRALGELHHDTREHNCRADAGGHEHIDRQVRRQPVPREGDSAVTFYVHRSDGIRTGLVPDRNTGVIYANRTQKQSRPADRTGVVSPHRSEASFNPSLEQVVAARQFASRVVADAGLSHAIHDVALATGELAANAAEHAASGFEVVVLLDDDCIRIEVSDRSGDLPVRPDVDEYAERGRGIALVELVSDRWGVDVTSDGKRIWAEISY